MSVKPIPEGYQSVIPYLVGHNIEGLIEFLEKVFDAKVMHRSKRPDGSTGHCEMRIADSVVMLGEPMGDAYPARQAALYVYVPNVDETYKKALAAGAKSQAEPQDHFYGDRSGGFFDPIGNNWWVATHIEDVAPEEIERRMKAAVK